MTNNFLKNIKKTLFPIKTEIIKSDIGTLANFAKDMQELMAHSGGSVGLTLASPWFKVDEITDEDLEPMARKFKQLIFGKAPIKSIQKRITEAEISQKERGIELPFLGQVATPEQLKGKETPLAFLGVGLTIGVDFTGWGGGKKQVANLLAKTSKVDDVVKILKEINVADDLIPAYSKIIAKTNKVDDVVKSLDKINEIQKSTKVVGVGTKTIGKIEPIAEEVTKYSRVLKERKFLQSVKRAKPDIPLKISGQYIPRSTDVLAIKAKNLVKESIETAENLARRGTNDDAIATASELIKHYSDEALKTTDNAIKNALYEKAADITHTTAKNLTEQGRAVQAASIMGGLTPEGLVRFAAREINRYNETVPEIKRLSKLTSQQTEEILSVANRIAKMPDGIEKAMAFHQLNNYIIRLIPSPLFKKLIGVWKAGLLTGIKTSGLNTFSNLFHGTSEIIKDIPAVAVDNVASIFTKKRTIAFTARGTIAGTKEGFSKGWRYLKTGFDERNIGIKLDWNKINFGKGKFAKGVQGYEETIFRIMGAEDQPFYYGAKAHSLASQAIAQAKNKGLKGSEASKFIDDLLKSPTDGMLNYAVTDAEMAVFQNSTALGKAARAIQNIGEGAGEFIIPFGRTPAAVATQLFNYSPLGIVKAIISNIGKGRFDQRLFSQAMGRGITGSAIMYIGTELFKKGLMALNYPTGEKEQKLWELEGKKANTINIGGKWRSPAVFGPAGFVLLVGGHYQQKMEETGSHTEALLAATAGGTKSLTEQTFLKGINQLLETLNDPQRTVKGYFSGTISSIIPTIVGDVAKATDEYERRTPGWFDKFLAKIPGLREELEPYITVLGKEKIRTGNFIEVMIDPSRPSKELDNEVVKELRRLFDKGYNLTPTQLGTKEGYENLTPEQVTLLWERTGELLNTKLKGLIGLKPYQSLDDEDKAKLIQGFVDKANLLSRTQMIMELTEGLSGQELKDKLSESKKSGLMTKEVFTQFMKLK